MHDLRDHVADRPDWLLANIPQAIRHELFGAEFCLCAFFSTGPKRATYSFYPVRSYDMLPQQLRELYSSGADKIDGVLASLDEDGNVKEINGMVFALKSDVLGEPTFRVVRDGKESAFDMYMFDRPVSIDDPVLDYLEDIRNDAFDAFIFRGLRFPLAIEYPWKIQVVNAAKRVSVCDMISEYVVAALKMEKCMRVSADDDPDGSEADINVAPLKSAVE